jgi:hypothetical protein
MDKMRRLFLPGLKLKFTNFTRTKAYFIFRQKTIIFYPNFNECLRFFYNMFRVLNIILDTCKYELILKYKKIQIN